MQQSFWYTKLISDSLINYELMTNYYLLCCLNDEPKQGLVTRNELGDVLY